MNKDIRKYITNCTLCCKKKAKVQAYPLQMTDIPDRPFDKIATDLVTECEISTSGNEHILITDHLMDWPEAFSIPDKLADTIVLTFINQYLPVHMYLRYILSDNGTEFTNNHTFPSHPSWISSRCCHTYSKPYNLPCIYQCLLKIHYTSYPHSDHKSTVLTTHRYTYTGPFTTAFNLQDFYLRYPSW